MVMVYGFLLACAIVSLFPLVWMFYTAFSNPEDITRIPPQFIQRHYTLNNFIDLFSHSEILKWLINSLIISSVITISHLFFDSLAGFCFARKNFPYKDLLFWMIIATMMIPDQVIMVPLYLLIVELYLVDSLWAVILPELSGPFGIFMMRQYMQGIPTTLEEAGRIDGLGDLGIYWHIILPLSAPALGVLGIFTFITHWNAFLWPLIVLNTSTNYTLPVGLSTLQSQHILDYGLLMAGAVVAAIPMAIIFLLFQRLFSQGMRIGALKG